MPGLAPPIHTFDDVQATFCRLFNVGYESGYDSD